MGGIVKYNNNGIQQWVARYNGIGNSSDAAVAIVVDSKGNATVTGTAIGVGGIAGYATIQYNKNGVMRWAQLYNAPDNQFANAFAMALDNTGNVYVTGISNSTATAYDYATIKYDNKGTFGWIQKYNGPANGHDYASAIAVDANNNVYVTGYSQGTATNFDFATIKYNQNIPIQTQQIVKNIQALATGLVNISQNDTVKQIVYQVASLSVDSFYNVRIDSLIAMAARQGIDAKASMNAAIASAFNLDPNKDHVTKILRDTKFKGKKLPVYISIPHFTAFDSIQLLQNPFIAYSHFESDYPIPCVNCPTSELTSASAHETPSWVVVIKVPPWYSPNGHPAPVKIYNCTASQHPVDPQLPNSNCQICPPPPSPMGGVFPGAGSSLMNHEIEINLGVNNSANNTNPSNTDFCLVVSGFGVNSDFPGIGNYAQLSMIPGFTYYRKFKTSVGPFIAKIYKLPYAIVDRCNDPLGICIPGGCQNYNTSCYAKQGDVLSLCANITRFNSWEEEVERFALGYGGIFKITRPGVNQKPLYFAFPYSRGLWWTQGADMRVYYGVNDQYPFTCTGGKRKMEEDYETRGCEFCSTAPLVFPYINSSNVRDYVASTDGTFMQNYWLDNVITVGFRFDNSNSAATNNNIRFFNAVASPPAPCIPSVFLNLEGQLTLGSDGGYEIDKDISSIASGTILTIHVRAKFINGESIDECQTLTIGGTSSVSNATVEIRGNIKDYNSSVVNYQIDIYK